MRKQRYSLDEISDMIAPIAEEYGIGKMSVFGSYARGDATYDSDLDVHLIDRGALRGLFRLMGFETALEERLRIPVDVVVGNSAFDDVCRDIIRDEIVVYDAG